MRKHRLDHDLFPAWLAPMALAGLLVACGGTDKAPDEGAGAPPAGDAATPPPAADTQPTGAAQAPADTAKTDTAKPGGAGTGAAAAGGGGAATPQQIALGDSIFHGQVGGATCYACHGQGGKGSAVGPNLTDKEWLNTDGSLEGIIKTIKAGVPTPKKAPAPMPPMGGAQLTDEHVRAVAAYEYSLSHGR